VFFDRDSFNGVAIMEEKLVVKSNALIQAAYSLTVSEQKIILSAITQVRRNEAVTDERLYTVTANALSDMSGFKAKNEYTTLKEAAEKLWNRTLIIHEKSINEGSNTTKTRKMRWVQEAIYLDGEGAVQLRFSKPILPYLKALSGEYSKYRLEHVANMTSRYGIRLYELLIQWRSKGEREIEITWLRSVWELETKYKAIKDFKKYVIEPAIADVNDHSDLWVKQGQRKTGRRVTHLQFQFGPKEDKKAVKRLTMAQIEAAAKPGETYEQVKDRLSRSSDG
jgi:plasmid replication initiation protein